MARINSTIPDDLDARITRLVDEGEFLDREEAIQSLLSSGLTAYRTDDSNEQYGAEFEDEFGTERQYDDDYVF